MMDKKILSIFLAVIFSLTALVTTYADSLQNSSSVSTGESVSSGSSGGGGSSSGPPVISTPAYNTYTAKGTIFLPYDMVAPKGGIDVYCAFGGVSFDEPNTMSAVSPEEEIINSPNSSNGENSDSRHLDFYREWNEREYEKYDIAATIPEGKNHISYTYTFKINPNYKAFYGKFWSTSSALSNQVIFSNVAFLSANKSEYNNINVSLNEADTRLNYSISLSEALDSDMEVYIIAKNNYEEYITKTVLQNGSTSADSYINVSPYSDYELSYYVPKSKDSTLQRIQHGLFYCPDIIKADTQITYYIEPTQIPIISGRIYLPDNRSVTEENLLIEVSAFFGYGDTIINSVICAIKPGERYAEYQLGIDECSSFYLCYEVLNRYDLKADIDYMGSYIAEEDDYGYDYTLDSICPVFGSVTLPEGVVMSEDSYFRIKIIVENITNGYSFEDYIYLEDDQTTVDYLIQIPDDFEATGDFVLYYNFGDVVSLPQNPYNPVDREPSNGGSSGGGIGSGGSGTKYYELPAELLKGRNFYVSQNGITLDPSKAQVFSFDDTWFERNITLAKKTDFEVSNTIGGYFSSAIPLGHSIPLTVSLINTADNSRQSMDFIFQNNKVLYIFETATDGDYILQYEIDGKIFYYSRNFLVSDIKSAEVIPLYEYTSVYAKDVYYMNTFPIHSHAYCQNNYFGKKIKIYDLTGNLVNEYEPNRNFTITIAPFIIGVDDLYFSDFDGRTFSGLTKNFNKAFIANSNYKDFPSYSVRGFIVDAEYMPIPLSVNSVTYNTYSGLWDIGIHNVSSNAKSNVSVSVCFYSGEKLLGVVSDTAYIPSKGNMTVPMDLSHLYDQASMIKILLWSDDLTPLSYIYYEKGNAV